MTGTALFALGAVSAALAVNVLRPAHTPPPVAIASFFAGWVVGELALHVVAVEVLVAAVAVAHGAWRDPFGVAGLALLALSWWLFVRGHARSAGARDAIDGAVAEALGPGHRAELAAVPAAVLAPSYRRASLVVPFRPARPGVRRVGGVVYGEAGGRPLHLDVLHRPDRALRAPALVYVHGGAWIIGHRRYQGLALMHPMAERGWVCFSVGYRLSPGATFPDHVVDVKKAIAWVRAHAEEWGIDPDFIVLAGNSAGGHLAALAALSANDPALQPGFASADTSVAACAAFYGVYDFTDRHGHWPHRTLHWLLESVVMKRRRADDPAAFERASPLSRVHPGAPPFLLVHGTHDSLVPIAESRRFLEALRERSRGASALAEIPGAQHAFEVFPSVRGAHVIDGVIRWLSVLWARHRARRGDVSPSSDSA